MLAVSYRSSILEGSTGDILGGGDGNGLTPQSRIIDMINENNNALLEGF